MIGAYIFLSEVVFTAVISKRNHKFQFIKRIKLEISLRTYYSKIFKKVDSCLITYRLNVGQFDGILRKKNVELLLTQKNNKK